MAQCRWWNSRLKPETAADSIKMTCDKNVHTVKRCLCKRLWQKYCEWQPDNQKKKKQCQRTCTYKALFVNAPDEVTTHITPGWLTEVCRYKSMSMTGGCWAVQMYELQLITDTGVTGTSLQRHRPPSRPNFWQRVHTRLWRNQILPAACRVARQRLVHPINSSYTSGKNRTSRVRYYW